MQADPNPPTESLYTQKIIQYTLIFGRPLDPTVQSYIDNNINWELGYSARAVMSTSPLFCRQYTKESFRERLQRAAEGGQGISFKGCQEISEEEKWIKWKGNFTADKMSQPTCYKIKSYFDDSCKLIQQEFVKFSPKEEEEQSAPEISFKDIECFQGKGKGKEEEKDQ